MYPKNIGFMYSVYIGLLAVIFLLAVSDIIVGVSNDAVNFLSSAVGARVATFKTILVVAAVGIFAGALSSNGMMEIARHGVLHPEMFTFREVMTIFTAVMVADVILLDIFNSHGLPTSTTVSMVFELIGGAFAVAIVKILADQSGVLGFGDLINGSKAWAVIIGIFVSVPIAFTFGAVVQWITRLVFTFSYRRNLRWGIGIFGGTAATAIIWFMLVKSTGNILSPETHAWILSHSILVLGILAVVLSLICHLLYLLKINVLRCLVLLGTFALAMAFAGNDLVNFIGVPLAALASWSDFTSADPGSADAFMMGSLNSPAHTPMLILGAAGAIMIFALATSKKAHNVINTTVDLSKQGSTDERFKTSKIARAIVKGFMKTRKGVKSLLPAKWRETIKSRFRTDVADDLHGAAFDELRATVNLVTASLLIAAGTTMRLPLSTTYVTFMVAMGSSLADKAWGPESAAHRITGVFSVIGGWFITAGAAFALSFMAALMMYFGGTVTMIVLAAVAVFLVGKNNFRFSKARKVSPARQSC